MRLVQRESMNQRQPTSRTTTRTVALCSAICLSVWATACSGTEKSGAANGSTPAVESTGAAAAPATAAGTNPTVPGTPTGKKRVVLLGTSLTAGLGLDPDKAYPALLQRKIDSAGFPITLVNAGLSGETSAGALRRAAWVLDQPAAAVVLEVGANDGLRGVDPDSTKANLVALINIIHRDQPTARVLLVQMEAPTNLGRSYTTRFHDAYAAAARETNTPLLTFLLDGVAGVARLNQADGIHPNIDGSRIVASTMWTSLAPTFTELAK
jgi:acyl-CoA thioesterase-1